LSNPIPTRLLEASTTKVVESTVKLPLTTAFPLTSNTALGFELLIPTRLVVPFAKINPESILTLPLTATLPLTSNTALGFAS
jgi:hypothetical protein